MIIEVKSALEMKALGKQLAMRLHGGEVIELVGDVGAGKTTFVKGIAEGLGIDETVQSPTFTVSRLYPTKNGLTLAHYDFYRLNDPGILQQDLKETMGDTRNITVIEWGNIVDGVMAADRLTLTIIPVSENSRQVTLQATGLISQKLEHAL